MTDKSNRLLDLLQQDIYTDAVEYAERISEVRALLPAVSREIGELEEHVEELRSNLSATADELSGTVAALQQISEMSAPIPQDALNILTLKSSREIIFEIANRALSLPSSFVFDIDSGESVRVDRDGNQWCARRMSFINLMTSPAGFGDTPMRAIVNLVFNEGVELIKQNAARGEGLHLQGFATDHIWAMENEKGFIGLRMDCGDSGTVYLTPKQAEEVVGCLKEMLSGQSAFQTMRKSAAERLAQFIAKKESGNCKTLEEALHHQSKWQRIIPEAEEMLKAAFPAFPDKA